jgi:hypothetical protein
MRCRAIDIEKVLWSSIEDYCGLWELVWEINTLHPNRSRKDSQHIALQCMLYLISKDWVRLFYCQEPYGKMIEIVDRNIYHSLLKDLKVWKSPLPGARSIRISATKSGEKYYEMIAKVFINYGRDVPEPLG